jgi:hypothetical protein
MAELQKGSVTVGQIILAGVLAVVVGTVCSSIKGSQDRCEADGGRPHGLECVKEEGK